ncbi:MAG: hypothetical protein FJ403_02890 [Verrucomicrobia bacterium]|nr:hypothetical protein [Verrucomicrobiota bacterium]
MTRKRNTKKSTTEFAFNDDEQLDLIGTEKPLRKITRLPIVLNSATQNERILPESKYAELFEARRALLDGRKMFAMPLGKGCPGMSSQNSELQPKGKQLRNA